MLYDRWKSQPMGNAIPCAGDGSAPHFQSEAIFTAKYFHLLVYTMEIKVSEEYGQPSARAGGSDAFKGANIAHPAPLNLSMRCSGSCAERPGRSRRGRGGKGSGGGQTPGPACRAARHPAASGVPVPPRRGATRLSPLRHPLERNEFFGTTWKRVPLAAP